MSEEKSTARENLTTFKCFCIIFIYKKLLKFTVITKYKERYAGGSEK